MSSRFHLFVSNVNQGKEGAFLAWPQMIERLSLDLPQAVKICWGVGVCGIRNNFIIYKVGTKSEKSCLW